MNIKNERMKNLLTSLIAGFIGGLLVFLFLGLSPNEKTNTINTSPSSHLVSSHMSTAPMDFVEASSKATNAVVHIYAEESTALAQQRAQKQRSRRPRSMEDFFSMDDFFGGDIFGRNFYRPKNGTGSGVIFSEDGYIVTNNHVVGFADYIEVTLNDGRKMEATRIGTDPSTDLAVLKIEESNLPTLEFANSDDARVGEWAIAVGNPFDLTSTVTAGIISAKGRDLNLIKEAESIEEFIQTDAAVNPGNSGGALVNTQGELIGINTAIATPTGVYAGYSFAIPANLVKRIVKDIIQNGNIDRKVSLGIGGYNVDDELKKDFNLAVEDGIYVDEVARGSAAKFGGILPGDVILSVNNSEIRNFTDLEEVMKFSKAGDVLEVLVDRNGKKKTIPVKLKRNM